MGNYISCTLSSSPGNKLAKSSTKVIFPNGEIRQITEPLKAAELMLEVPNCFVVNTISLQMGRRFSALNADEDLEMGNVYAMFPMRRVNSFVTAADMGALFLVANSAAKRVSMIGEARALPEKSVPVVAKDVEHVTKLNVEDIEEFSFGEFKHRLSMCRSKKPLLETITEEPICSI